MQYGPMGKAMMEENTEVLSWTNLVLSVKCYIPSYACGIGELLPKVAIYSYYYHFKLCGGLLSTICHNIKRK
jgi:hypothetical protein